MFDSSVIVKLAVAPYVPLITELLTIVTDVEPALQKANVISSCFSKATQDKMRTPL